MLTRAQKIILFSDTLLGTAGTLPPPPGGFIYLLGADGAYLKGADGAYLLGVAP